MKYNELVKFDPINEVVKFNRLNEDDYRKAMVTSYVFSRHYERDIIPNICNNLDYNSDSETFGLQIVGTYGTGKSHLMSLISLVAENKAFLPLVQSEGARNALEPIAGMYKIIRFELGSAEELWGLVCFQIDEKLREWNINYSISEDHTRDAYKDKLARMMAQFENAFPEKGMMIVIDEMLSYLKGRSGSDKINRDLAVLQALGEFSDHSKFRIMYGVQELIYKVPEFGFAANMLTLVGARYKEITITGQDVKYVVEKRILQKTDEQKSMIRSYLERYTPFFTDMHANFDEYINLFPVHPSFFENFQHINVGNNQREILKTVSSKFRVIADADVPDTCPGLICYDSYWDDLSVPSMQTYSDINRVKEIMTTIYQKINDNFTGPRRNRLTLAHRIAEACAVKILQESLDKLNGTTAEKLVDDLCYLDTSCIDREFLIDIVNTTASQIVTATSGQYFERNSANQQYHIRTEGGVNFEQRIRDFVPTMTDSNKDSYFYGYLVEKLPIEVEQYRFGFKIFQHSIEWTSHKVKLDGYIFMGNPSERDTTHPTQNFYIYFMPIFDQDNMERGEESDSVYFCFDKVSDEMKEKLELYAAARAIMASADTSQKPYYQQFLNKYTGELDELFKRDFVECTEVYYQGNKQTLPPMVFGGGNSKEEAVSNIASMLLEDYFCSKMENYPKFNLLYSTLTESNRETIIRSALRKVAEPTSQNRDGEAILIGLGLLEENQIGTAGSIYAETIRQKLNEAGEGKVVNRDAILYNYYHEWPRDWRTNDYNIEADLEFVVLTAMAAMGEIEIVYDGGITINAANLRDVTTMSVDSYYSFSCVRKPKEMNVSAVRELFLGIMGKDLANQINNPEIYPQLIKEAGSLAARATVAIQTANAGMNIEGIKLLPDDLVMKAKIDLQALIGICDRVQQSYTTPAKMRNLPKDWTGEVLREKFKAKSLIVVIDQAKKHYEELNSRINYLNQAIQYVPNGNDLKAKIGKGIERLSEVLPINFQEQSVSTYVAELDHLKESYIDWYLAEYNRCHITELQLQEKQRLLNDPKNTICRIIASADNGNRYFSTFDSDYVQWKESMSRLTTKEDKANHNHLLNYPYANFNPTQYVGQELPKISTLRETLEEIYSRVDDAFHNILKDEGLLVNRFFLNAEQQTLLDRFNNGEIGLTETNAKSLYEIVVGLHEEIRSVDITMDEIHRVLNRPMRPDEAAKAFADFLKSKIGGAKVEDVRIILK